MIRTFFTNFLGQYTTSTGMSQIQTSMASVERVEFDEDGENGLIITGTYLPEELLSEILFYVDHKTLLNCQLVCKRWYLLLKNYVWRKKAEAVMGRPLLYNKQTPWLLYYVICTKKSLEKNLMKNHSGKKGRKKHWKITSDGGHKWAVECPPRGVPPLPISESVFEGTEHCFVTSFGECCKVQTVDLASEGLLPPLLDQLQLPVVVSEWYSCRWDCPATYRCSVKLVDEFGRVLDNFDFADILEHDKQNTWLSFQHEFTNYGPGLRKVIFSHAGRDQSFWAGHYGSKMAGACVKVILPKQELIENKNETSDGFLKFE